MNQGASRFTIDWLELYGHTVKGIGEIKAKKIIYSKNSTYGKFKAICEAYKSESEIWKEKLKMNYKLLKFQ